jgi:hypothetical protein
MREPPMTSEYDEILDSLFHGCALRAYLEIAAELKRWPPPAEPTRRRAYDLYEQALAEKNRRRLEQRLSAADCRLVEDVTS